MIALGSVALLRPWWLLAIPVILILYGLSKPRGGELAGWETAADAHLLAAMVRRGSAMAASTGGRLRTPALLVTLIVGTIALAGPAVQQRSHDRLRNLDATLIALDVSQDMTSGNRIREAAAVAHDLLSHIGARQAGLIVYAGDAYVASGLTDFSGAIDADLFALDDSTVPDPGVRPDRALRLAAKVLDEAHILRGDVVLISAGGGLSGSGALRAASALAGAHHRVFAVDAGLTGKNHDETRSRALEAVAAAGNGFAVPMLRPDRLLTALSDEEIRNTGGSAVTTLDWRDLGRLLLVLAAVPLLLGFRKAAVA